MSTNSLRKKLKFILLASLFVVLIPRQAQAYIGPGAGFALVGSFLVMFTAVLSAILGLFTWPLRYIIRAVRSRRAFARSRTHSFRNWPALIRFLPLQGRLRAVMWLISQRFAFMIPRLAERDGHLLKRAEGGPMVYLSFWALSGNS